MPVSVSEPGLSEKGRIFGCALLLCVVASASLAEGDILARLTGTYGDPFDPLRSCQLNPEHVTFSHDGARALIAWQYPIDDYLDQRRTKAPYTVLSQDADGVAMQLDGEERLTDAGAPVVWIMRPAAGLDGYCWGRTDWPRGRCQSLMLRCAADMPLG